MDHEPCADQFFAEVNLGIGQKGQGHRIDHNPLPGAFEHKVLVLRQIQLDVVLKPGTPAAFDRNAQGLGHFGTGIDFGQPGKGAVGHLGRNGQVHRVVILPGAVRYRDHPAPRAPCQNLRALDIGKPQFGDKNGMTRMTADYAAQPDRSRGRLVAEEESAFRSCFQRDRDRIIHASAFRRLKHKTQVFVEDEGDVYRTRLTHTIEVAQVARTIAGALGLNPELTEAVALAHDLGHTPFGHTGEDALHALMQPYGGFDHNAQAIRIVTDLERHYARFDGLNLTWETLEGIAKHNGPVTGDLPYALASYTARHDLELHTHASAEAQVAALSDDIAYNNHDLHDGLRAGLFRDAEIAELPLVAPALAEVDALHPGLDPYRRRHEALRRVFGAMVADVIDESRAVLRQLQPRSVEDIRTCGVPVIRFSDQMVQDLAQLKAFLFNKMYRAPDVMAKRAEVTRVIEALFPHYLANPQDLPQRWQPEIAAALKAGDQTALARIIADYIAGMTDRFALAAYARLSDPDAMA